MKTFAQRTHQKCLELACEVEDEVPEMLHGDPTRLRQVINNLVGNALKFTEKGEIGVEVHAIHRDGESTEIQFTVYDTGIGLPEEKQQVIFEAFSQADGSTSRKYGGTGLGLTISSRLAAMMGGRIWVESEVERGSRFHFTARFPIARSPLAQSPILPVSLAGLPVLVVDDNLTNRRILKKTLSSWGAIVEVAESGRAAIDALQHASESGRPLRLLITDAQMPGMDGFALARRVRQDPRLAEISILMMTSADQLGDAARRQDLGISGYLSKPARRSDLYAAIATAFERTASIPVTPHLYRDTHSARGRILLVEDNRVNQAVALRLLQKHGHSVVIAGNGREALNALDEESFDLVLMDVQMPDMDGFEATAAIRERERTTGSRVPIIAMTAHAMKGDEARCLIAGMDGYLSKPISPKNLFGTLERYLSVPEVAHSI